MNKEECLQMIEKIKDFVNDNCDKEDVYTLHHLENYLYEVEKFVKGVEHETTD